MATAVRPDTSLGFRTSKGDSLRIEGRESSLRSAEETLAATDRGDRVTISESEPTVVDPLVYNLQQFAESAKDAADEIAALRGRQTELAYIASEETVDGRTFSNLQDEFDAIDSEVSRIQQTATYNDTQVLSARTLRVSVKDKDINATFSVADPTPITTDRGYSIESIATVDTAYTQVQQLGYVARSYGDDRAIGDSKADNLSAKYEEASETKRGDEVSSSGSQRTEEILKKAEEVRSQLTAERRPSGESSAGLIGSTLDTEA